MTGDDLPVLRAHRPVLGRLNPMTREIRAQGPVVKVRTVVGDEAWLVTRYAEMKRLLLDERLGNSHPDPDSRARYLDNPMLDLAVTDKEPAVAREIHGQIRTALTPHFSAKRMSALRSRIARHAEDLLDGIVTARPPVDMHVELSTPLSFQVLCDLLGVSDGPRFRSMLAHAGRLDDTPDTEGADGLFGHIAELVAGKRAAPGDDMISALCASGLPDDFVCALVTLTSFSYLATPSNLSAGIALFAANPDQREKVLRDPGLIENAVEEVVRLGKLSESFVPRYANADIEIGGVVIKQHDLVLCDHYAANYDDQVFDEPERFDVTRSPNPHLAFSHGFTYCIGAPLARLELSEALGALLRRLPTLTLAVPIEEIAVEGDVGDVQLGGGIARLPVTW